MVDELILNVPISVCAPEKSIVPCACATLANVSATSAGHNTRVAWNSLRLKKGCANRLAGWVVLRGITTWLVRNIGTSIDWSQSGICRDDWARAWLSSNTYYLSGDSSEVSPRPISHECFNF